MFTTILVSVAAFLIVFILVVGTRPSEFRLTRSISISAPPPVIFAQVNDLRQWQAWSPWEHLDPALQRSFEGPAAGTGASYAWVGNKKAGAGRMTIIESRPGELIRLKLEFLKPFQATSLAEFTFKPESQHTVVTWSMSGKNNFMAKAFHLFVDFDKMVGGDFDKGLAQIKVLAEAGARP